MIKASIQGEKMQVQTDELVKDLNDVPKELRDKFEKVPEELHGDAEAVLDGADSVKVKPHPCLRARSCLSGRLASVMRRRDTTGASVSVRHVERPGGDRNMQDKTKRLLTNIQQWKDKVLEEDSVDKPDVLEDISKRLKGKTINLHGGLGAQATFTGFAATAWGITVVLDNGSPWLEFVHYSQVKELDPYHDLLSSVA